MIVLLEGELMGLSLAYYKVSYGAMSKLIGG